MRNGFLHDTRAFHHLREKHLAFAKEVTNRLHATHEWPFDDLKACVVLRSGLLNIVLDVISESF